MGNLLNINIMNKNPQIKLRSKILLKKKSGRIYISITCSYYIALEELQMCISSLYDFTSTPLHLRRCGVISESYNNKIRSYIHS